MKSFLARTVAFSLLAIISGCGERGKPAQPEARPAVSGVTVGTVATAEAPNYSAVSGTVRSAVIAAMAARIAGAVDAVHVREGDHVAKGKLLITLHAEETAAGASGAKAAVEEAQRGVNEARSRKKLAEETFMRYENLFREQAVTRQEFDIRSTEKDVAVQGLARAEARLVQATEQARSAGALAGYARITAPISGVVTGKFVERGATVFPGMPLLTVEVEDHYRLEASIPETLSPNVRLGQTVEVMVDGVPDQIRGTVSEIVPVADQATRTRIVKIDISAKGLRSGTYGRALIPTGSVKAMTIPRSALVERGMLHSVWVVDRDNTARMRLVKSGGERGDRIDILSGLADGERIVTGGVEKVSEGIRIQ